MQYRENILKVFMVLLTLGLLAVPGVSFADWGVGINFGPEYHRDAHFAYRWHDHPHWGWRVHYLPHGYFTIWVRGARYYYYDGLYYNYVDGDYVLINPPMGAVVNAIPPDFQAVVINGRTYYTNNGTYYVWTRHGYKVVRAPVVYAAGPQAYGASEFPVNIPNAVGGYVTVVLKRSHQGFVGPQGEFYATFPSVAQLRVMYGR